MSEWKEYKLNDLVTKLGDGLHGTPKYDPNGDYYFINGSNLINGKISVNENTKKVTKEEFEKYKKELTNRTIFVSINGTLGNIALYNDEKVVLGKSACYFNIKEDVSKEFIKYIVTDHSFQHYIYEYATGSTIKNVPLKAIREYTFKLPDLQTQTNIAEILSSLDDKIELNNKINQELETLAQTLFKQWFIDFEFPNENGEPYKSSGGEMLESELGEIPKGWKIYKFKEIVAKYIDNRGKTPPIVKDGIPLVEVKHMVDVGIFPSLKTDKFLSDEVYNSFLRAHLQEGDILMSTVGTIGRLNIVPNFQIFAIAQNVLGIRFKKDLITQLFMFCLMRTKGFNDEIKSRLIETVQSSIKRGDLEKIPVLLPNSILVDNFENLIENLFNQIKTTTLETIELIKLRDTLLPKLISGELEINEINN